MRPLVWAACLLSVQTAAQPTPLRFYSLSQADGLSGFSVTAAEVDRAGFLWLGAGGTVDRFDGSRVRTYEFEGVFGYVYAIEEALGFVWAGGPDGLWSRPTGSPAFEPAEVPGLGASGVRAMASASGTLWVGTTGAGLLSVTEGGVRRFTATSGHIASDTVTAVVALSNGVAVATNGGVSVVAGGRLRWASTTLGARALAQVGGRLWAGLADGRIVRFSPGGEIERVADVDGPISSLAASDAQPGLVWVGVRGGGVWTLDANSGEVRPLPTSGGVPEEFDRAEVLCVEERSGVLFVGTTRGLFVAEAAGPRLPAAGRVFAPDAEVMAVHISRRDRGYVWLGSLGEGVWRVGPGAVTRRTPFPSPHPLATVFSIYEDQDGAVWLGGQRGDLWEWRPEAGLPRPHAVASGGVVTTVAPNGESPSLLWVGSSTSGLLLFDRATKVATPLSGPPWSLPARDVRAVSEEDGVVWVASADAGLWRLLTLDAAAERAGAECGVGTRLLSVAGDGQGGAWVGSATGALWHVDHSGATCKKYGPEHGLPEDAVGGVFPDSQGGVWASTNVGLYRLSPDEGVASRFDEGDGLPTASFYWYARDQAPTGEIGVGGLGGAAAFDPAQIPVDNRPARTALTRVRVEGEEVSLDPDGLDLSYRMNDVTFEYAGLDLRQPWKTRFRVRLLGASEEWEPAGSDTRYRALSPGDYVFEVSATNRDGFWGEPASVPVRVRPPLWWTAPFWVGVIGVLGAVGYAAHAYRVRQIRRVERTRRRIADDLHDGIGSKIASVALRLDMAGRSDEIPPDARESLTALAGAARSVVGDLRDTVWLVDSGHDDLAAVVARMEQFATGAVGDRGDVVAPPTVPAVPLPMGARRDLYFLFTEAVHNAVRHSGASRLDVRIEAGPNRVGFMVEDDGVGFDPSDVNAGRGLTTMRQRAKALGGHVTWSAREGGGTAVRFATDLV